MMRYEARRDADTEFSPSAACLSSPSRLQAFSSDEPGAFLPAAKPFPHAFQFRPAAYFLRQPILIYAYTTLARQYY
jgi:hypothetical protein